MKEKRGMCNLEKKTLLMLEHTNLEFTVGMHSFEFNSLDHTSWDTDFGMNSSEHKTWKIQLGIRNLGSHSLEGAHNLEHTT